MCHSWSTVNYNNGSWCVYSSRTIKWWVAAAAAAIVAIAIGIVNGRLNSEGDTEYFQYWTNISSLIGIWHVVTLLSNHTDSVWVHHKSNQPIQLITGKLSCSCSNKWRIATTDSLSSSSLIRNGRIIYSFAGSLSSSPSSSLPFLFRIRRISRRWRRRHHR